MTEFLAGVDMHALVVEDDCLVARDCAALLRRQGASSVDLARSAEEALRAAERCPPRVALVDIHIDGPVNGMLVGEMLAQDGAGVIYISGRIDQAVLWGRGHAVDILRKPVDERELKKAVATAHNLPREEL